MFYLLNVLYVKIFLSFKDVIAMNLYELSHNYHSFQIFGEFSMYKFSMRNEMKKNNKVINTII